MISNMGTTHYLEVQFKGLYYSGPEIGKTKRFQDALPGFKSDLFSEGPPTTV